jgi:hypothetical protein
MHNILRLKYLMNIAKEFKWWFTFWRAIIKCIFKLDIKPKTNQNIFKIYYFEDLKLYILKN